MFRRFQKAFDSVDHKLLLQQLVTYEIKGNFLKVIKSLYDKDKSCVRGNDSLTDIFPCNRGLRQGCLLSPVLFALYLNDLNRQIKESSQGVLVDDISINSLLYADDLVLIAKDRKDLQSQLDTLDKFSKSLKMEVNLDKTKVMLIQKQKSRAKSKRSKPWKIGNKELKECTSYKYVGVTLKSNGSYSEHIDKIKEKALKSCFSLISKSKEWGGFQPRLFLYLLDHTIAPILNYSSEIWGFEDWPKLEILHLKACKYALGTLRVRYEIQQSDTRSIIKYKIIKHFQSEVLHGLNEHITDNRTFNSYASFKTNYKFECYLDYIPDFRVRCSLAKLKLSAHNLQIEIGRFSKRKIPKDKRFCLYCKSKNFLTVENESHFVLTCPLYKEQRRIVLEAIHKRFPTTASLNNLSMYKWLMTQEDYNTTKCLGMFCKKSFDIRTNFLGNPSIL